MGVSVRFIPGVPTICSRVFTCEVFCYGSLASGPGENFAVIDESVMFRHFNWDLLVTFMQ